MGGITDKFPYHGKKLAAYISTLNVLFSILYTDCTGVKKE
jgi:hypothetical protein